MIGTTIDDRYRVNERLARQGIVEIFEGIDLREGRSVWIRQIGPPLDQDLDFIDSWRAQLVSVRGIDDPHLPRIYASGRTSTGELYQVEEPAPGLALRRYTAARAPMGVAASVAVAAAAARAAGIAHAEGVAHGGLNPETIFINEGSLGQPEAFVTGWETGEALLAQRRAGEPIPDRQARYMAPEQSSVPAPPPTPTSDVFSLGTIFYELLTGSLPNQALERGMLAEPTPPRRFNPDVPPGLERVLLRALSRDPAARQPNGHVLAQALTQAVAEPEPVAPPPPIQRHLVERIERVRVRPPAWMPAALLAALSLICILLTLLVWNRDSVATEVVPTPAIQTVPNLVGPPYIPYNQAVTVAWNQGFTVSIVGFRDDTTLPPGVVVAQCPAPGTPLGDTVTPCALSGTTLLAEDTILVEVTSLPEPLVLRVVPDLYGQPEPEGRTALELGGLRLGTRREAYDLLLPAGRIVEQNPRRGLAVPPGTSVDVIVSAGAPPLEQAAPVPTLPAQVAQPVATLAPTIVIVTPTLPVGPALTPTTAPVVQPTQQTVATPPTSDTPVAAATPVTGAPVQTVLLEEDFEDGNELGWNEEDSEAVVAVVADGTYQVVALEPGLFWKGQPGRLFDDFTYRAAVTLDETVEAVSSAGIVFRVQDDEHFYLFEINPLGQFQLRARNGTEWVFLMDWTADPAIRPAGENNILAVSAEGERLTLFVNDSQVAVLDTLPEVTYLAGDIGVGVETAFEPTAAEFDNILVTR